MRGEDDFTSDSCRGFVESDTLFLHTIAYRLQNCERAVTFVKVKHARRYSHCLQSAKASNSQKQFLPDPDASVTAIQSRRQIPVFRAHFLQRWNPEERDRPDRPSLATPALG